MAGVAIYNYDPTSSVPPKLVSQHAFNLDEGIAPITTFAVNGRAYVFNPGSPRDFALMTVDLKTGVELARERLVRAGAGTVTKEYFMTLSNGQYLQLGENCLSIWEFAK
jgi:hypothetical protein